MCPLLGLRRRRRGESAAAAGASPRHTRRAGFRIHRMNPEPSPDGYEGPLTRRAERACICMQATSCYKKRAARRRSGPELKRQLFFRGSDTTQRAPDCFSRLGRPVPQASTARTAPWRQYAARSPRHAYRVPGLSSRRPRRKRGIRRSKPKDQTTSRASSPIQVMYEYSTRP